MLKEIAYGFYTFPIVFEVSSKVLFALCHAYNLKILKVIQKKIAFCVVNLA